MSTQEVTSHSTAKLQENTSKEEPKKEVQEELEEELEEQDFEQVHEVCPKCKVDYATMANEFDDECESICADCFWTLDAEIKRKRRADPEWRYWRAYSAAKALFNKTNEEAHEIAKAAVANM